MTVSLHIDESGFTGRQLLDPLQRHFVLGSSLIDDTTAAAILRDSFPDYRGAEFKFEKIWKRPTSRRRLADFLQTIGPHADQVYVWHIDKRFALLIKMLEFLMEPDIYDRGGDWYSGYGPRISNYFHFGLTRMSPSGLYEEVLTAYYNFARRPTEEGRLDLSETLKALKTRAPEELGSIFSACIEGVSRFHRHHDMAVFKETLDIYVTSLLNVVSYWTNRRPEGLAVQHDESSALFQKAGMWSALTSARVAEQQHPVRNGPPIAFPLPVLSTTARRSDDSPAIQLCDLIAGFTVKTLTREVQSDLALMTAMRDGGFGEVTINGVAPGTEFPEGPPPRRLGKDAVDRMVDIIRSGGG